MNWKKIHSRSYWSLLCISMAEQSKSYVGSSCK